VTGDRRNSCNVVVSDAEGRESLGAHRKRTAGFKWLRIWSGRRCDYEPPGCMKGEEYLAPFSMRSLV
jgi:hypothetical protein